MPIDLPPPKKPASVVAAWRLATLLGLKLQIRAIELRRRIFGR